MKKVLLFLSVVVLAVSLAGCGKKENKLVIWSFTDELETQGDIQYFKDNFTQEGQKYEGMEVEFVIVPTDDYLSKVMPALRTGDGAPDVFTGELDMVQNFMEAGYLANLEELMKADEDLDFTATKNDFQSYIWESAVDPEDGNLKALSWQVTPGAIFFKTDMATAVWGDETGFPTESDDGNYNQNISDWVSANKFNSLDNLVVASQEVKDYDSSWRLFPNDDAIRFFSRGSDDASSWLAADGKISADRLEEQEIYMEAVKGLYGESIADSLTANIGEWSGEWFGGIGENFEDAEGNTYQTMAYTLPTWGLFYVIAPNVEKVDASGETCSLPENPTDQEQEDFDNCDPKGNWGMGSGPNSYYWGGTYLNIRKDSEMKDAAYDFVSSMLFDTERMTARAENGDVYSRISVMNEVMAEYEGNPVLGGMNHYQTFLAEAEKISFDNVTKYDRQLDNLFGQYVTAYKKGESGAETLAEAFNSFYNELETTYNEIYRESGLPYQE
ncbi:MAG: extracellular solute-binding protein [Candidatus Izimaplasma sp.]|nr:extracellular solute-binding protein [Candidatus Izimaplasma bacterium]